MKQPLMRYVLLAVGIFFLDRVTKMWALTACHEPCVLNRFVSFELVRNIGVSWGLFSGVEGPFILILNGLVISISLVFAFIAWYRFWLGRTIWAEAMVLGGALSNILDRFVYGGVIDFIVLSYKDWTWPVFNIADVFIVFGIGVLVLQLFREGDI